jgi:hypothetical protein
MFCEKFIMKGITYIIVLFACMMAGCRKEEACKAVPASRTVIVYLAAAQVADKTPSFTINAIKYEMRQLVEEQEKAEQPVESQTNHQPKKEMHRQGKYPEGQPTGTTLPP